MKRGLTIGELRQVVYRAEDALVRAGDLAPGEIGLTAEEIGLTAGDVLHGIAMPLIQIAQELNEIKTILSRRPQIPPTLDELIDLIARACPPGSAFTTHEPVQFTTSDGAVVVVNIIGPDPRIT